MINRLFCVGLLAALVAAPAGAGSKKPAKDGIESTLVNASAYCERVATRAPGTGILLPTAGRVAIHDGSPPALGTPDLVKRFAETQPSRLLASGSPFYVNFLTEGAQVWAVVYGGTPTCDVVVTGAAGDMPAIAARLAESMRKSGWQIVESSPASGTMPLAQHVLAKKVPAAAAPENSMRLQLRALSGTAADPAGVQLEMSIMAGTSK
jgi:hypothetical protein